MASFVIGFQILLARMEGVGVLHGEFPHANQSGPRSCLVPKLGLNLIDHKRVFQIALTVLSYQMNGGFLVCHAEHKRAPVAVGKSGQLFSDAVIPSGFLPEGGGHDNRKLNLLTVNRIHFFPNDLLNFSGDFFQRCVKGEDSVGHGFQIPAAHHQSMAVRNTFRRSFPKTLSDKLFQFHLKTPPYFFPNTKTP